MAENDFGKIVHHLGPGGFPQYKFVNHDENYLKLFNNDNPNQYLLIDKQSLIAFSEAFSKLGKEFTV